MKNTKQKCLILKNHHFDLIQSNEKSVQLHKDFFEGVETIKFKRGRSKNAKQIIVNVSKIVDLNNVKTSKELTDIISKKSKYDNNSEYTTFRYAYFLDLKTLNKVA